MTTVQIQRDSLLTPFLIMLQGGVPFRTLIDIGCADGTYSLDFLKLIGAPATICNIDANGAYEPSLARIQSALGGHYRICAVSAFNGRINLTAGTHEYWTTVGGATSGGNTVECRTLDSLCEELGLRGPYFVKMDIEGAELAAVLGAERTLADTAGLLLEANVYYGPHSGGKFADVDAFLSARGFSLFDLVSMGHRPSDNALYQVYAAFLNTRYEFRDRTTSYAGVEAKAEEAMRARRSALLARNDQLIAELLAAKDPPRQEPGAPSTGGA